MKWTSSLPVYYWAKFIGLAPFTVKNNRFHPPTMFDKSYTIVIAVTYLLSVSAIVVPSVLKFIEVYYETPFILWISLEYYTGFVSTFFTLMIFVLSYEKILSAMNNLCTVSSELKTLGIEEDHEKLFDNILATTATSNVVMAAFCVSTYLLEPNWDYSMSIEYSVGRFFTINILLIYSQTLRCIKRKFILLNERLLNILEPAYPVGSQTCGANRTPIATDLRNIRKIESLHLELCDLVDGTIRLFAIPIIINAFELFGTLTISCYYIYQSFVQSSHRCGAEPIIPLNINVFWVVIVKIIVIWFEALIVADESSSTCEEGNTTAVVLFKVWNKFKPLNLKTEFTMFTVQMIHKPVTISVWGIFDVDSSLICKIVGTGIAYLIIMIQMDASRPCS